MYVGNSSLCKSSMCFVKFIPKCFSLQIVPSSIVLNKIFLLLEAGVQVEIDFLIELISFDQCKNHVLVNQFLNIVNGFYFKNRNVCE